MATAPTENLATQGQLTILQTYLNGFHARYEPPLSPLTLCLQALTEIDDHIMNFESAAKAAGSSEDAWSCIYHSIFSDTPSHLGPRVDAALQIAGIEFEAYNDQHPTYAADCIAWINAFRLTLNRVNLLHTLELEAHVS